MGAGQRPLYNDATINFKALSADGVANIASQSATYYAYHGRQALSASNILFIGGADFTVALPGSLSAAHNTPIYIDFNNSALIDGSAIRKGTASSFFGGVRQRTINSSFSANWVALTAIAAGQQFAKIVNTPVRWARLRGTALTSSTFVAYVDTDNVVMGV